jgi:hypothetical protein
MVGWEIEAAYERTNRSDWFIEPSHEEMGIIPA